MYCVCELPMLHVIQQKNNLRVADLNHPLIYRWRNLGSEIKWFVESHRSPRTLINVTSSSAGIRMVFDKVPSLEYLPHSVHSPCTTSSPSHKFNDHFSAHNSKICISSPNFLVVLQICMSNFSLYISYCFTAVQASPRLPVEKSNSFCPHARGGGRRKKSSSQFSFSMPKTSEFLQSDLPLQPQVEVSSSPSLRDWFTSGTCSLSHGILYWSFCLQPLSIDFQYCCQNEF